MMHYGLCDTCLKLYDLATGLRLSQYGIPATLDDTMTTHRLGQNCKACTYQNSWRNDMATAPMYGASFIDHGDYVEIRLPKQRIILTAAEYRRALTRGKAWSRADRSHKDEATRAADRELRNFPAYE